MSREALSMCKHLTNATVRGDVNGQYHWAELLRLDAISNGANGPEERDARRLMDNQDRATPPATSKYTWLGIDLAGNITPGAMSADELNECRLDTIESDALSFMADWDARRNANAEDAIEEARR